MKWREIQITDYRCAKLSGTTASVDKAISLGMAATRRERISVKFVERHVCSTRVLEASSLRGASGGRVAIAAEKSIVHEYAVQTHDD